MVRTKRRETPEPLTLTLSQRERELARRDFLRLGAAALVGLPMAMAACGASTAAPGSSAGSGISAAKPSAPPRAQLPTYVPVQGPKPDLPGTKDIDPGYFSFPKNNLFQSVKNAPGKGGDVTVTTWTLVAPPAPFDQNPAWQAVNKAVNANLKVNVVPFADYNTKFAALTAGGDIPDILYVAAPTIEGLPDFLRASCVDLAPYVSGDAIKGYPNLANIPSSAWKSAANFYGGIYGVPVPFPPFFWIFWVHQDMLDQAGLQQPGSADDWLRGLKELTKPSAGQFGLGTETNGGYGVTVGLQPSIFGAPNNWKVDPGGKLVRSIETAEYKAALGYARDMYSAGVYDPNSATYNTISARADFMARKFAFRFDGWQSASVSFWDSAQSDPTKKYRVVKPFPAKAGDKASYFFGPGIFGFSVIKKASSDRVKEVLRIMDYMAAPFGSQEHLLLHYGVQDTDYKFDDNGNPVLTPKGKADAMPWQYITAPPGALYYAPNPKDYAQVLQDAEKEMFAAGVADPTVGLYSPANASKGTVLNQKFNDGINDIVTGRTPLTTFDQLVLDWKANGGDQIRTEFQALLPGQ